MGPEAHVDIPGRLGPIVIVVTNASDPRHSPYTTIGIQEIKYEYIQLDISGNSRNRGIEYKIK